MQHIDRCSTYRQNGAAVRQTIRIHDVLLVKILSVVSASAAGNLPQAHQMHCSKVSAPYI